MKLKYITAKNNLKKNNSIFGGSRLNQSIQLYKSEILDEFINTLLVFKDSSRISERSLLELLILILNAFINDTENTLAQNGYNMHMLNSDAIIELYKRVTGKDLSKFGNKEDLDIKLDVLVNVFHSVIPPEQLEEDIQRSGMGKQISEYLIGKVSENIMKLVLNKTYPNSTQQ